MRQQFPLDWTGHNKPLCVRLLGPVSLEYKVNALEKRRKIKGTKKEIVTNNKLDRAAYIQEDRLVVGVIRHVVAVAAAV